MNYEDRTKQDFLDEFQEYRCSCGGFRTKYPEQYSKCPNCGAPVEEPDELDNIASMY